MRTDSGAIFIRLEDVVGADRYKAAIANLELAIEFNEPFGLPAILGAVPAAAEDENHRILSLEFGQLPVFSGVVRKLVVGEEGPWNDVLSHRKSFRAFFRKPSRGVRRSGPSAGRCSGCRWPPYSIYRIGVVCSAPEVVRDAELVEQRRRLEIGDLNCASVSRTRWIYSAFGQDWLVAFTAIDVEDVARDE